MRNRLSPFSLLPLAAALAVTSAMAATSRPAAQITPITTAGTTTLTQIMPTTPAAATPTARPTTSGSTTTGTSSTGTTSPASATTPAANGALVTTPAVFTTGPTGIAVVTDNGFVTGGVSVNGERLGNPATVTTELAGTTNFGIAESELPQVGMATSAAADPAVRKELRKRQNLKRNGQLLYSIAPRTNVDRGWQMPDDPPSPALRPPAG